MQTDEEKKAQARAYHEAHRDEILARHKAYYANHREELRDKKRFYYIKLHGEVRKRRQRTSRNGVDRGAYYLAHRDEILQKYKEYHQRTYAARRDKKNAQTRERRREDDWYRKNAERIKAEKKAWYEANREEVLAKARQKAAVTRKKVLDHYGGKCACCGETEYKFLAIDHINGNGAKHRKELGSGGSAIYRWLIKNNYPSGFQVLCHNCNAAKGLYGKCPHTERSDK